MAINKELLEILCCPESRVELRELTPAEIAAVNQQIETGAVKFKDGKPVEKALREGLITVDTQTIYRVDDEIPIMLVEMGIPTEQLTHFKGQGSKA